MADEIKTTAAEAPESRNFIHTFIEEDIAQGGQFEGMTVHTRFPPEPNGYLHIGHCKALTIDFGTAEKFGGLCNLRMDDTNPTKEDEEFVDAIKEDIHWLGFDWGDRFFYGSDYFEEDYRQAVGLIKKGLAYVCELSPEEFSEPPGRHRRSRHVAPTGTVPWRRAWTCLSGCGHGEFPDGSMTLRAKIDLASGNFNMRDPVIYRINYMHHHRQGNKWCIYPMYDFAHPIQDALEGITHSLCSLEFEAHRPLYNWVIEHCDLPAHPRQIEFARLGIDHTVMSKRKLRKLVEEGRVSGWDDPRMPTLCGLRRRGYTAPVHPEFLRAHRRGQVRQRGGVRLPGALPAGGSERDRPAGHGGAAARQADHHQLSRGEDARPSPWRTIPWTPPPGTREVHLLPATSGSRPTTSWQTPVPKYKRLYPDGPECRLKGAYLITLHRLREGRERQRDRGRWPSMTPTAGAATPPTAGR